MCMIIVSVDFRLVFCCTVVLLVMYRVCTHMHARTCAHTHRRVCAHLSVCLLRQVAAWRTVSTAEFKTPCLGLFSHCLPLNSLNFPARKSIAEFDEGARWPSSFHTQFSVLVRRSFKNSRSEILSLVNAAQVSVASLWWGVFSFVSIIRRQEPPT